jgi:hypothetical protein
MSVRNWLALLLSLASAACASHPQRCEGPWQAINPPTPHAEHPRAQHSDDPVP